MASPLDGGHLRGPDSSAGSGKDYGRRETGLGLFRPPQSESMASSAMLMPEEAPAAPMLMPAEEHGHALAATPGDTSAALPRGAAPGSVHPSPSPLRRASGSPNWTQARAAPASRPPGRGAIHFADIPQAPVSGVASDDRRKQSAPQFRLSDEEERCRSSALNRMYSPGTFRAEISGSVLIPSVLIPSARSTARVPATAAPPPSDAISANQTAVYRSAGAAADEGLHSDDWHDQPPTPQMPASHSMANFDVSSLQPGSVSRQQAGGAGGASAAAAVRRTPQAFRAQAGTPLDRDRERIALLVEIDAANRYIQHATERLLALDSPHHNGFFGAGMSPNAGPASAHASWGGAPTGGPSAAQRFTRFSVVSTSGVSPRSRKVSMQVGANHRPINVDARVTHPNNSSATDVVDPVLAASWGDGDETRRLMSFDTVAATANMNVAGGRSFTTGGATFNTVMDSIYSNNRSMFGGIADAYAAAALMTSTAGGNQSIVAAATSGGGRLDHHDGGRVAGGGAATTAAGGGGVKRRKTVQVKGASASGHDEAETNETAAHHEIVQLKQLGKSLRASGNTSSRPTFDEDDVEDTEDEVPRRPSRNERRASGNKGGVDSNAAGGAPSTARAGGRKRGADGKKKRVGLPESSPVVNVADAVYAFASVGIWMVAVLGLVTEHSMHTWTLVGLVTAAQIASMAWTALRFFVQTRSGTWEIVAALPEIRAQYRATWFAFDAFCACPIDFVFLAWSPTAFFVAQMRQLVRIVRLVNLTSSSNPLREKRLWLQLYVFMLVVAFVVHTATCVFKSVDGHSYQDALYWTAATMSSVGYGDIVPKTGLGSRVYAVIVMTVGVVTVASITAFTTSFMTSRDSLEQSTQEKKQMLASMLEYYRIPWEEQIEIIGLFPTALNAENEKSFTQLVENMPAFIVEKIEGYTRAKQLAESIPLFSELPVSIVLELTSRLHHRFVQANDVIIQHGTEGFEMFFLVRGVADVVVPLSETDELVVAVLRSGQFFGEMALIENTTRTASVVAVVPCELLVLSKPDFVALMKRHDTLRDIFQGAVFARHGVNNLAANIAGPSYVGSEAPSHDKDARHSLVSNPTDPNDAEGDPPSTAREPNPLLAPTATSMRGKSTADVNTLFNDLQNLVE